MPDRYDVRTDGGNWAVFDHWTGETVVIARVAQNGLTPNDAAEIAAMLNRRAAHTEILQ